MDTGAEAFDEILRSAAKDWPESVLGQCPDDEARIAYLEGTLVGDTREDMENHLARCSRCREFLVEAAKTNTDAASFPLRMPILLRAELSQIAAGKRSPQTIQLAYRAGKRLLEQFAELQSPPVPEPLLIRGERRGSVYGLMLAGFTIKAVIDRQENRKYEIWLRLEDGAAQHRRCEWQLWSGGQLMQQEPARQGEVLFCDLESGSYECILRIGGTDVGAILVTVVEDSE